jgi:ATP-dependent Lon protease
MPVDLLSEIEVLQNLIKTSEMPPELRDKALAMTARLNRMAQYGTYAQEFEQVAHYIDWITHLPWNRRSEDILDLTHAKEILDKNHYGLSQIKERITEYLAVMQLKRQSGMSQEVTGIQKFMRAPILFFVGLVGTGKTTIAYSIAEAMGRKFERIPFGGLGDPLMLRGQSRAHPDAEPGMVIKSIRRAGVKNPIILLDELDRVTEEGRSSIMGTLVELLDPEQNAQFNDHFLDYPFDLSEVLFIATANNTANISTAVLDRLEVIQMPSYSDDEKIHIGKEFVLPRMMMESGIPDGVLVIDDSTWHRITRPLGFDAGIRTLERTINGICRKVALEIIEGKATQFHLTEENIKGYLPTW